MKKRIIPILLLFENKLIITINFTQKIYIGDPINAVRIFNSLKADELIILDIGSRINKPSDDKIIFAMFDEAFMPISFGGGIGQARNPIEILKSGAERLIINSQFFLNDLDILSLSKILGSQSLVGSIDLYFDNHKNEYCLYSPHLSKGVSYKEIINKINKLNIGELMINFVDKDGTFSGLNINFFNEIKKYTNIPIIACGGASSLDDMILSIKFGNCNAAAAGALFVLKKNDINSVMINYPSQAELTNAFK